MGGEQDGCQRLLCRDAKCCSGLHVRYLNLFEVARNWDIAHEVHCNGLLRLFHPHGIWEWRTGDGGAFGREEGGATVRPKKDDFFWGGFKLSYSLVNSSLLGFNSRCKCLKHNNDDESTNTLRLRSLQLQPHSHLNSMSISYFYLGNVKIKWCKWQVLGLSESVSWIKMKNKCELSPSRPRSGIAGRHFARHSKPFLRPSIGSGWLGWGWWEFFCCNYWMSLQTVSIISLISPIFCTSLT